MASSRGRTPKPLHEHLLENEKLYGQVAKRAESEPVSDLVPTKPEDLSPMESGIWDYYEKVLDEYKLFTLANGPMLRMLVRMQYEEDLMNREIDTRLPFCDTLAELKDLMAMRDKTHDKKLKLLKQMSLTPAEIAKLHCTLVGGMREGKKGEKDEFFDE